VNRYLAAGMSMLAGGALAAGAVEVLHAQAKPPAFAISEITVKDSARYESQFIPAIMRTIRATGATIVVRGGRLDTQLGTPPASRIVVVEFPSFDQARAWWNSQSTQDAFEIGKRYASFRQFVVEGASR
jgi:uncharacterized protein (DUF1330 family)